MNYLNQNLNAF